MKVIILNGSPHIKGCTARALREAEETLNKEGIETETIMVGNKNIRGCIACNTCGVKGKCVFEDLVNETAPKFEKAEGLIAVSYTHLDVYKRQTKLWPWLIFVLLRQKTLFPLHQVRGIVMYLCHKVNCLSSLLARFY